MPLGRLPPPPPSLESPPPAPCTVLWLFSCPGVCPFWFQEAQLPNTTSQLPQLCKEQGSFLLWEAHTKPQPAPAFPAASSHHRPRWSPLPPVLPPAPSGHSGCPISQPGSGWQIIPLRCPSCTCPFSASFCKSLLTFLTSPLLLISPLLLQGAFLSCADCNSCHFHSSCRSP